MARARLVFADGTTFEGRAFTDGGSECSGEVVFNTAMTGYQEVLTDPSYAGQIVLMTYPMIGSYGINDEDVESRKIFLSAFVVKEYVPHYSNWRANRSLKEYLEANNILGVEGIDTRSVTRYLRDKGAAAALLTTSEEPLDVLVEKVRALPAMAGQDLALQVAVSEAYDWEPPATVSHRVAVIDCGVKYHILRLLTELGCACRVFPAGTSAETILEGDFDGVFISNGPGDPEPLADVIRCIQGLVGKVPIFGICLGHQLLSLALGAKTFKLKFGHHGANHPIKNLETGRVEITSQNHGFAVDPASIDESSVAVTHINLNDQTVAGIRHLASGSFSVQYHPESSPGPHDSRYFFHQFVELMKARKETPSLHA